MAIPLEALFKRYRQLDGCQMAVNCGGRAELQSAGVNSLRWPLPLRCPPGATG
jgi:hypothetical protein